MKAEAFVMIPKLKSKGTEVEIEILPLVLCKECECREDPKAIISEWLPCQFGNTPDEWFCASGRKRGKS